MSRRTVIWDSHCSFCRRSVVALAWLDWLRQHRFVGSAEPGALDDPRVTSEDADRAVQLLTEDGRFEGYDAIRRVLARCPLTFWLAPILWLLPVRKLGERIYWKLAASRTCAVRRKYQKPVRHPGRAPAIMMLVALQFAIPFLATSQGVPRMFGFHMFTGQSGSMVVDVRDTTDQEIEVELSRWIAERRDEIDWRDPLAHAICADIPEASTVTITQWHAAQEVRCGG